LAKKRHHKRRLIQADFIALLARKLKPGSYVAIATDWADYAMAIEEAFSQSGLFELGSKSRFPRPLTAFEKKALDHGRLVYDFYFTLL